MTTSVLPDVSSDLTTLKQLVQRHRVCWESYPLTLKVPGGELRHVGYELELFGTHDDHPLGPVTPGCSECRIVYHSLLQIAHSIVPREPRATRHAIEPYDVSLCFSPKRKFRKDVRLTIQLVHREGFDLPIDECEDRCLGEMKEKLKELGVRRERW